MIDGAAEKYVVLRRNLQYLVTKADLVIVLGLYHMGLEMGLEVGLEMGLKWRGTRMRLVVGSK